MKGKHLKLGKLIIDLPYILLTSSHMCDIQQNTFKQKKRNQKGFFCVYFHKDVQKRCIYIYSLPT